MPTNRKVIDFKIHNLTEEQFQELKEAGQIDPNAIYCTPDETVANFEAVNARIDETNKKLNTFESGVNETVGVINTTIVNVDKKVDEAIQTEQQHNIEINARVDETVANFEAVNAEIEELSEQINTKQDIATAVNYSHVTNCITEIPQDIKLELNNGILTLKAGSKLTDPTDGTQRTTTEDKNGTLATNGQYIVFADKSSGGLQLSNIYTVAAAGSGSSLPADGSTYRVFYNANDRTIYRWNDSSWVVWGVALPLGIITVSDNAIYKIDEIFNGFGYMGSSWFLLPKLTGLIPDKFNADGTLKNIKVVVNNLVVQTMIGGSNQKKITLGISATGNIASAGSYKYIESENINTDHNIHWHSVAIAEFDNTNGKISRAVLKKTFHAVDYNDLIDTSKNTIAIAAPAGIVAAFAGTTAPAGWLRCDGSAVSRTRYAKLFAAIGGIYGVGDGSTTFNLPNLIGRVPFGMTAEYIGQRSDGALPNITGQWEDYTNANSFTDPTGAFWATSTTIRGGIGSGYNFYSRTISFGADRSSPLYDPSGKWYGGGRVIPSSLAMNYCIKY